MKITVIHNIYTKNSFILETILLNLKALKDASIDYQYILFNDHGDKTLNDFGIELQEFEKYVDYYYSPINYGRKKCTGGWSGAEKENLIEGDIIHNIGQDDVMTSLFYEQVKYWFEKEIDLYFITANGFKVNEDLSMQGILIHPQAYFEYRNPLENFKQWFGITNGKVTRANNNMLASGTIYKRELHNKIGLPDLDAYGGASDFFYWANILYHEYRGHYIQLPCWYYRQSRYSAGNEVINGLINRGTNENPGHQQIAIKKIQEKYAKLVEENQEKFK